MEYLKRTKIAGKHEARRMREHARLVEKDTGAAAQQDAPAATDEQPLQGGETPLATLGDVLDAALKPAPPTPPAAAHAAPDAHTETKAAKRREEQLRDAEVKRTVERYSSLAIPELRAMAEAGDRVASFALAHAYRENGYERESYLPLLREAAAAGVHAACSLYGLERWQDGQREEGERMVREAAAHGSGEGAFLLYRELLPVKEEKRAMELLELSGKCSFIPACKELSRRYYYGNLVKEDDLVSAKWMKRAADLGDVDAMYRYARQVSCMPRSMFPRNRLNEACNYFRKAMESGHIGALFSLARLYSGTCTKSGSRSLLQGNAATLGCSREYDYYRYQDMGPQAVGLYLKAAAKSPELLERVRRESVCLSGWYERELLLKGLADLGDAESMYALGNIHMQKHFEWMNPDSLYWYRKAAALGHKGAAARLRKHGCEFPPEA